MPGKQNRMLDLAIIIVSWNVRNYLANCLNTVYRELRHERLRGDVWVIDNGSTDGTLDLLADVFPQVQVIANQRNVGFGAANNQGMRAAAAFDPRYHLLLNADTVLPPGAMRRMVDFLDERPDVGMVGPRLVYGDGRFQHSAFAFPGVVQLAFDLFALPPRLYDSRWNGRYPRRFYNPDHKPFAVDFPLGATMMVRRDVAEVTGGFDESFHMYCEEVDWCWRIRKAGWSIYTVPAAEIIHYGGESTRQVPARSVLDLWRSRAQLYAKHHGRLRRACARPGVDRPAAQGGADPGARSARRL